jgi:hypothetical protein
MWRRVDLVRTAVSNERVASIFSVERISDLITTLAVIRAAVPSLLILSPLKIKVTSSFETFTWLHIPEDGILNGQRQDDIKSYIALTGWAL